jgi:hypothetical protein
VKQPADSDRDPTPYYILGFLLFCFLAGLVLLSVSVFFG